MNKFTALCWMAILVPPLLINACTDESSVSSDHNAPLTNDAKCGPGYDDYIVQPSDTLWDIAEAELGDGNRWREILKEDGTPVSDTVPIMPNEVLCIPGADSPEPIDLPEEYGANDYGQRVVGYFENWAQWRPEENGRFLPDQINPHLFTHINFAFGIFGFVGKAIGGPEITGDFKVTPIEENDIRELYPALQNLKRENPMLKTLLSIGGWSFNDPTDDDETSPIGVHTYELFSKMVSKASSRTEFIDSIVGYVRENGFDGIDIDWEYPGDSAHGGEPSDYDNYLKLLAKLRERINNEDNEHKLLLTIAAPAIPKGDKYTSESSREAFFDWMAEVVRHLDWINVMTYDYHGAFDNGTTGVNAPLTADTNDDSNMYVAKTIKDYLTAGVPRQKIVMGIPTYGRSFQLSNPPSDLVGPGHAFSEGGSAGPATKTPGMLAYYEIADALEVGDLRKGWDEKTQTPYAYDSQDGIWVSYDDTDSVGLKGQYSGKMGLGGVMFWAIGLDAFDDDYPLISQGRSSYLTTPYNEDEEAFFDSDLDGDGGKEPAIAINDAGAVVLVSTHTNDLSLQIGQHTRSGIVWSDEVINIGEGENPAVALNNNGYVIVMYECGTSICYRIGQVDLPSFSWVRNGSRYTKGRNPSVALNDDNIAVEVHEGASIPEKLWYAMGPIDADPGRIQFYYDAGNYSKGTNPAIAFVPDGKHLIEVHKSDGESDSLWYMGVEIEAGGKTLSFDTAVKYDSGRQPAIAMTQDGYLIETHRSDGAYSKLWYRVAQFKDSFPWLTFSTDYAIAYATGEYPSISITGSSDDYRLVEAHGADVFEDGSNPPDFVSAKTTIPIVHELLENRSFMEKVGIDLESHGLCLEEDQEEIPICALEIGPCRAETHVNTFKFLLTFVPGIGQIVSLIDNAISCHEGNQDACTGVGIDSAFLALGLIPGANGLKGSGKAIGSAVEGVKSAAKRGVLAKTAASDSDFGPIVRWWQKARDSKLAREVEMFDQCGPGNRSAASLSQSVMIGTGPVISTRALAQTAADSITDYDLGSIYEGNPDSYNQFIRDLRAEINTGLANNSTDSFERTITLEGEKITIKFKRQNLYIIGIDGNTLESLAYKDRSKACEISTESLVSMFHSLKRGDLTSGGALSEPMRKLSAFTAEAARFGAIRNEMVRVIKRFGYSFDMAKYEALIGNWLHTRKFTNGVSVGIGDTKTEYGGDGKIITDYGIGVEKVGSACKLVFPTVE